jgi:cytochrome b561
MPLNHDVRLAAVHGEWRYAPAAVALHWLVAALIVFMAGLGWYMMSIEDEPGSGTWFDLHKSVGIVEFWLVFARLAWRMGHRPAGLPASVPRWEASAAALVQGLMYVGMILLPVTGFIGASYTRSGVAFFGLELPRWRLPDHDTAEAFFEVHETIVWIMVGLVALHTLAALKHAFVDRDRVFRRMWF